MELLSVRIVGDTLSERGGIPLHILILYIREAIDYFIKYAGCDNNGEQLDGSPMKGGIVLFASGNANTSDPG